MRHLQNKLLTALHEIALVGEPVILPEEVRRSWLRRLGVLLIALKCIALPLILDPSARYAFAVPKAAASRAVLYLLVSTLAVFLFVHRRRLPRWSPVYVPVLLLVAAYLLATLTALHLPTALYGAPERHLGLVTLLDNVVFAIAIAVFARTERDLLVIGLAAIGAATLALVYGGLQAVGQDPIPWDRATPFSTFGNSGSFAGYLLIAAAAVAALLVVGYRRLPWGWRLSMAIFCTACASAILLRGSRASALSVIPVAGLLIVLAVRSHAIRLFNARPWIARFGTLSVLLAASVMLSITPVGDRVLRAIVGGDASTTERAIIYRAGLETVRAHPLLGVGPDNFVVEYPRVREAVPVAVAVTTETSPHSWVLKTATDAGLLGFVAWSVLATVVLIRAWQGLGRPGHGASAVGGMIVVGFLAQGALSLNDISTEWTFWLGVGLVAAAPSSSVPNPVPTALARSGGRRAQGSRRRVPSDAMHALAAAAVGVIMSATVLNALSASQLSKLALVDLAKNDPARAVAPALEATRRDGGRGEPWNALGAAYSLLGRSEQAVTSFRRAVDLEPYKQIYWMNLADEELILAARGTRQYAEAAVADGRAAVTVAPTDAAVLHGYARILNILGGRAREAADYAAAAARLTPDQPSYVALAVLTYEQAGDLGHAIEWQRRFVDLEAGSLGSRLRLARLYLAAGDQAGARAAVAPPQVKSVDRDCGLPPCFRVLFTTEVALRSDPLAPDSVVRPENFRIDGRPLPSGASVSYDQVAQFARIVLPPSETPLRLGAVVVVQHISSILGFAIQPDPTMIELP